MTTETYSNGATLSKKNPHNKDRQPDRVRPSHLLLLQKLRRLPQSDNDRASASLAGYCRVIQTRTQEDNAYAKESRSVDYPHIIFGLFWR